MPSMLDITNEKIEALYNERQELTDELDALGADEERTADEITERADEITARAKEITADIDSTEARAQELVDRAAARERTPQTFNVARSTDDPAHHIPFQAENCLIPRSSAQKRLQVCRILSHRLNSAPAVPQHKKIDASKTP